MSFMFNVHSSTSSAAGSSPFQGELMLTEYFGLTSLHTQKEASYGRVELGALVLVSCTNYIDSK